MGHKNSGQMDFADSLLKCNPKLNQQLNKIDHLIDWTPFEKLLNRIYDSPSGRPSYPVLLLFKSLLIQAWYDLSDYALEEALDDRLSFRRFVSLSVSEKAPDHSVFSRFRDQLLKHGIQNRLFEELNRQLEVRGLLIKTGTLVDATVIQAAPKKPLHSEDGSTGKSEQDPDAKWTKKGSKYLFGYKAHVGVDHESELIRKVEMTPANVHDGKMLGQMLSGDEEWAFADKAYDSVDNHEMLAKKGISNGILFKAVWNKALTEVERLRNRILSRLRSPVERIFGTFKRSYSYCRARYIGLKKNQLQLVMVSMAYNLRRMSKLCS